MNRMEKIEMKMMGVSVMFLLSGCFDCSQAGCRPDLELAMPIGEGVTEVELELCHGDVCYPRTTINEEDDLTLIDEAGGMTIEVGLFQGELRVAAEYPDMSGDPWDDDEPLEEEWTLAVTTGEGAQLNGTVTPVYERHFPNGEMCAPSNCYHAEERIEP